MKQFILILIVCAGSVYAYTPDDAHKTVTSTGALDDTQAAITYAEGKAQDGWTIIIPTGGPYTWNGHVTMSNSYVMTLKGADPSNRPVITIHSDAGFCIFTNSPSPGKVKTIRDIILTACTGNNGILLLEGRGANSYHLHNVQFLDNSIKAGWIGSLNNGVADVGPFGLVEHCQIVSTGASRFGFFVHQNELSPDASWGYPGASNSGFSFGSSNAAYFEDNTATAVTITSSGPAFDGANSCKVVIRHNHLINTNLGFHGPDSPGPRQSMMQAEVMHNDWTITDTQGDTSYASNFRGGAIYFWDNSIAASFATACGLQTHCASPGNFLSEGCKDCNGNLLSAPLTYPADYPICQQVGYPGTPPTRLWSNNYAHDESTHFLAGSNDFIQRNRNFFSSDDDSAKPAGYTEFTYPFDNGVIRNEGGTPQPPTSINVPAITGGASQGQILTADHGFWTGDPYPTFTYQWQVCDESGGNCSNLSSATAATYTQTSADIGRTHRVVVGAVNSAGGPIYATSPQNDVTAAPGATNRLTNGGFEARTGAVDSTKNDAAWVGWVVTNYGNGWIQSTTDRHSGNYAFEISKNTGSAVMAIEQTFAPANPGETMQVSFWQKNSVSGYGVAYYVKDVTHNTNIIAPTYAGNSIGSYGKVETSFVVPPGCLSAKIGFDSSRMGVGGGPIIWLDDIVVAPPAMVGPSPPQNLRVSPTP